MTDIKFVQAFTGAELGQGTVGRNDSVMEVAIREGVPGIFAECGGSMSCATCHVFISPQDNTHFEEQDISEAEMVEELEKCTSESRLSCQLFIEGDATDVITIRVVEEE